MCEHSDTLVNQVGLTVYAVDHFDFCQCHFRFIARFADEQFLPSRLTQAMLVSEELIRVAILWHELWHEGLEEASRLYFGERNIKGEHCTTVTTVAAVTTVCRWSDVCLDLGNCLSHVSVLYFMHDDDSRF